jgi:hypothetical protein
MLVPKVCSPESPRDRATWLSYRSRLQTPQPTERRPILQSYPRFRKACSGTGCTNFGRRERMGRHPRPISRTRAQKQSQRMRFWPGVEMNNTHCDMELAVPDFSRLIIRKSPAVRSCWLSCVSVQSPLCHLATRTPQ